MAQNPNVSLLDAPQITKRVFDVENDSVRVSLAEATGMQIELNADDGDNVAVLGKASSTKASITNASTGVILPAQSCEGMKSVQLFANTTSTITGPQVLTVEVSPSDTDDVWVSTALTLTPTTAVGAAMGTALTNLVAKRIRVKTAAAITSGAADIYLVMQGV